MTDSPTISAAKPQALLLSHGLCTTAGIKAQNEDAAIFHWPDSAHLQQNLGAVAAVADGVSSAEAGATMIDGAEVVDVRLGETTVGLALSVSSPLVPFNVAVSVPPVTA